MYHSQNTFTCSTPIYKGICGQYVGYIFQYLYVCACMCMYMDVYVSICMYVILGIEITKRICCPKGWAALPRIEDQKHNDISTKPPLPFLGFELQPAKSYVTMCATQPLVLLHNRRT